MLLFNDKTQTICSKTTEELGKVPTDDKYISIQEHQLCSIIAEFAACLTKHLYFCCFLHAVQASMSVIARVYSTILYIDIMLNNH